MTEAKILLQLEECDLDALTSENVDQVTKNIESYHDYWVGASKLVIDFDENLDYVVKIPFAGYIDYYEEEFFEFCKAPDRADGNDYCKAEVVRFKDAEEEGLDFLFAETSIMGFVKGHPIYKQPKCVSFEDTPYPDLPAAIVSRTAKACSESYVDTRLDLSWLTQIFESYGKQILLKFLRFLDDEDISDLHQGNFGYCNGDPVLIDYASFYDYY